MITTDEPPVTYRKHLARLTCVWINLDESTERAAAWTSTCAPLFRATRRQRGVPVSEVTDEQFEDFIVGWKRTFAETLPNVADRTEMFVQRGSVPKTRYDSHTRRAQCALTRAHVLALRWGLDAGLERFVVSEDDAFPRVTVHHLDTPVPPRDVDIAVHGGALAMAAHAADDRRFAAGHPHRWVPVRRPFNALCATTYEVTRRGAEAILRAVAEHPMLIDHAWGFALRDVPSAVVYPNIFPQVGVSTRGGSVHRPTLVR